MKITPQRALVGLIALAGLAGSLFTAHTLRQAIARAQDLYRIDTVGSQLEGQLEYQTQESRRAFLYALAISDPNDQLPYIDAAREASVDVQQLITQVRALGTPALAQGINQFEASWNQYRQERDQILARILEGDAAAAIAEEQRGGDPAFARALQDLHNLNTALAQHARVASSQVNATLMLCAVSLFAFAVSTLLVVALLIRANHGRSAALKSLSETNQRLVAAKNLEQRRAGILELVSKHAPLSHVLEQATELFAQDAGPVGVAAWSACGDDFRLQESANIPRPLVTALGTLRLTPAEQCSAGVDLLGQRCGAEASQFGLRAGEPLSLRDATGQLIGVLVPFGGDSAVLSGALLSSVAQLASVAVENSLLYERLAFQAQHDTLTALPNRLLFHDRVQQAMLLAARHQKHTAVIMLDLDRYKQINDTLGHRAGDELLVEVGRRLKACLRQSDAVGRIGGDEFSVLLQDLTAETDAESVAEKILAAVAQPMQLGDHEVVITATAGIGVFPEHGSQAADLLRNADVAMYAAKRAGGNTYCLFRHDLGDSMRRRLEIERELKTALEHNEFSLQYQPLVKRDGELAGLEALLRWNSHKLGRVGPAEFIPIAEDMGLMPAFGAWLLESVCRTGARWLNAGYDIPRISINASPMELVQKSFAATVERALDKYGFPSSRLEVEITETALMNNIDLVLEQMGFLRERGVRFAIDDFGTGYSSLSQLQTLPVDRIKVDRAFVKDLASPSAGSATLVRAIIALAHNLHLETVAEGIETQHQLAMLAGMGCDIFQGFLFHGPMPPDSVVQLFQRREMQHVAAEAASVQQACDGLDEKELPVG